MTPQLVAWAKHPGLSTPGKLIPGPNEPRAETPRPTVLKDTHVPWSSVARPTGIMTQEAAPTQGSDGLDTLNGAILLMIEKTRVRSGAGLLALLIFAPASMAATYQYSADTTAPARRQGMVSVSGINWNCQGSRCTTSGPWATPAVGACRALAQQVGPVRGYGRKGRVLTAGSYSNAMRGCRRASHPARRQRLRAARSRSRRRRAHQQPNPPARHRVSGLAPVQWSSMPARCAIPAAGR